MADNRKQYRFSDEEDSFELDPHDWSLFRNGKKVSGFGPKDFWVLMHLVECALWRVTEQTLLDTVWRESADHHAPNTVSTCISHIRKILDKDHRKRYIETAPPKGYRFVLKVEKVGSESGSIIAEPSSITMNSTTESPSWLYTDEELAKIESTEVADSVWIISPDLANLVGKQVILAAVSANMTRGIKYTYMVPKSDRIRGVKAVLENLFGSHGNQLPPIELEENEFRLLCVREIAVFDATMKKLRYPEVYLELPVEEERKRRGYWIKVSDDEASELVGRFRKIIDDHRSGKVKKNKRLASRQ